MRLSDATDCNKMDSVAIEYVCRICREPGVQVFELTGDAQMDATIRRTVQTHGMAHDECQEKRDALFKAQKATKRDEERSKKWETLCPAEFQKPIQYKGTTALKRLLDRYMAWDGKKGLYVFGKPGKCKTRFMWNVLKREFDAGKTIFAIEHSDFRTRITGLLASEQNEAARWLAKLSTVDILSVDDFGKGRFTDASGEATFDLLNARYANNKRTLFTSNDTIQVAAGRFGEQFRVGLERRLNEMCDTINADEF